MKKDKIIIIFGTRPEAIKMAPVIKQFKLNSNKFSTIVCVTAQHREMLDQVLNLFEIIPDYDLNLMTDNQTLPDLTSKALTRITEVLKEVRPDVIFVQGDTTTTFIASLAAYYLKIKIAHIEAGLRTNNKYSPFPEEINRQLTTKLADYHFPPTEEAKNNLLREGIIKETMCVTGNTVIDALQWVVNKNNKLNLSQKWEKYFNSEFNIPFSNSIKSILVTGHRRESFGDGFRNICESLSTIAKQHSNIQIIYPVHLNPNVQKPVYSILENIDNIYLIHPLDYEPFSFLLNKSHIVLTDSGGIQEEAPSLGKPVLVMRDTTERPEGVTAGTTKLIGTNTDNIIREVDNLLLNTDEYNKMAKAINPYGDGNAANNIYKYMNTNIF